MNIDIFEFEAFQNFELCENYGEPGYFVEDKEGIIVGDWNDIQDRYPNVYNHLEKRFHLEWCDEWIIDYDYSKCYRTSPDCYFWVSSIRFGDGYILTPDDDIDDFIELCTNNPNTSMPNHKIDEMIKEGFELYNIDGYKNGLRQGMNDDPKKILEKLEDKYDVIFSISGKDQFSVSFDVYVKNKAL